jgi:arylsulfatase A-like enzyme
LPADLVVAPPSKDVLLPKDVILRPGIALLSIVALLCLSLEIELLQQIDGLCLYLTSREIALEVGVVLLVSLAIACCWWLFILIIGQCAAGLLRVRRWRIQLIWCLWIAIPLTYLLVQLFEAFTVEVFPNWHQDLSLLVDAAVGVICICIACFFLMDWHRLQEFCRTRLVPIAWFHIVLAIVAAVALWLHGVRLFHDYEHPWEATAASNSPDIYLITLDALRADDMSVYGYGRATTPNLERFAEHSFTFDYYFANSNFTPPATTSMETGKLPWSHRVFQSGFLRDKNQQETLAALLKEQGYYTAMISSNFLAAPFRRGTLGSYDAVEYASPKGLTGLRYRASNLLGVNTQTTLAFSLLRAVNSRISVYLDRMIWGDHYLSPAEDVFERATKLLEWHKTSQPIFLWCHIFPPHDPYWPPASYRHRFVSQEVQDYANFVVPNTKTLRRGTTVKQLRSSYDEMILYADHSVGEFLDWLGRTGRLDRSIIIVSADHGDLFEHNRLGHGGPALYNGVIHIPLLIHLPGQENAVHIEEPAEQADLLPTLLDMIGAPLPSWTDGISLRPALEAKSLPERYVFSMNLEPNSTFASITKGTVAVVDNKFKFVRDLKSGQEQLYSYRTDEGEEHDLVNSKPEVVQRMRKVLLDKLEGVNRQFPGKP